MASWDLIPIAFPSYNPVQYLCYNAQTFCKGIQGMQLTLFAIDAVKG